MNNENFNDEFQVKRSINTGLRLGFIALVFVISYLVIKPFIAPLLWGIIISVSVFPLHLRLTKALHNKEKLSAIIIVIVSITFLVIAPSVLFTASTYDTVQNISQEMESGKLAIPPPDKAVESWPIVGETIYKTWKLATKSLSSVAVMFEPQLKKLAPKILIAATSFATTIFFFILAIIISGAILINAEAAKKTAVAIFRTLAGEDGEHFALTASATIRTVVHGVIGTAFIQAALVSAGLFAVSFPGAEIISLIVLFVAIAQLPVLVVMIPVVFYVFSYTGTTVAIIFTIWVTFWSLSDNLLKPLLMGKKTEIPVIVIMMGVIGGLIMGGIIGLFIGAVLLSFAYKVLMAIIKPNTI